jgi:hypothetical protein
MVRRAIDHYDAHQRTVLDALADGVRDTLAAVERRFERTTEGHEQRLDGIERSARASDRRLARLADRIEELERTAGRQDDSDAAGGADV